VEMRENCRELIVESVIISTTVRILGIVTVTIYLTIYADDTLSAIGSRIFLSSLLGEINRLISVWEVGDNEATIALSAAVTVLRTKLRIRQFVSVLGSDFRRNWKKLNVD